MGPTLTATIEVEGEVIEALLDTGSPVTITRLETLLQMLANKRCSSETPAKWRTAVESRLEPSAVVLQNYSGDKLRIVREITVTVSRSGHSARAITQVQKGAPAKLLVDTNLLSKLGYYFVQASEESTNCNAFDASVHKSDDKERKVNATVPEVTQENVDNCDTPSIGVHKSDSGNGKVDATVPELAQQNGGDCDIPIISVHKSDNGESKTDATVPEMAPRNVNASGAGVNNSDDKQDKVDTAVLGVAKDNVESMEVEAPSLKLGTVSLIQAVKIPARHEKLVRVQVTNNLFG